MAGIDRAIIIQGPCQLTFGGIVFFSKGDVIAKPSVKRIDINTAEFGKIDERIVDRRIEVTFEPAGSFTNAIAAVLWPYGATAIGASIYGASDNTLLIHGSDGKLLTIKNAALTQMPNLRFGVDKTVIGSCKFTGLIANSTAAATAGSVWAVTSVAFPAPNTFSPSTIWTQQAVLAWGSSPWDAVATEGGVEISFPMKLSEVAVDGLGTVDMRLTDVGCSVKATPVGIAADVVMAKLHESAAYGAMRTGTQMTVQGTVSGSPLLTIPSAVMVDAETGYGASRKRVGACEWAALRTFSAYAAGPPEVPAAMVALFTIAQKS